MNKEQYLRKLISEEVKNIISEIRTTPSDWSPEYFKGNPTIEDVEYQLNYAHNDHMKKTIEILVDVLKKNGIK